MLQAVERHQWPLALPELQPLRWQASQIRQANRRILQSLSRLAVAFRDLDVGVLLLKGAALNLTLYDHLDQRPMSDLDLLVRPADAARAMMTLEQVGFQRGAGLVRDDFFPRFHYATEFRSESPSPVRVDLHVRPFRPLRYAQTIPDEAFWHRARAVDVGRASLRVPADEEQFVHLATHSAVHGHTRLLWLYDLCRLLDTRGADLDWDRTVRLCKRLRLVLPVRDTLHKLETLWGPLVPDSVREAMNTAQIGWRDGLCLAQAPHDATRPIRHVVVNLLCMRGIRFRLGYLLRLLLPGRRHMAQVYYRRHRGWLVVAHLRRWLRALLRPAMRSSCPA